MLNIVAIQGKLLKDITLREANGGRMATFTIINTRDEREKNGDHASDFFDIIAWGELAKFASENFRKGDRIVIVGRIQHRLFTTAEGERRKQYEIVANKIYPSGTGNIEL